MPERQEPNPDDDDRRLLAAHVDGQPDAFRELVERHRDRLWTIAYRTLGDRSEAEDAVQEALLKAYANAGKFRGDAAVSTWLYRIVTNACIDLARRRRHLRVVADEHIVDQLDRVGPSRPDVVGDGVVANLDLQRALASLPIDQRLAVVYPDILGLTSEGAASALGIPVGTLKSRNARGKAAMRRFLTSGGNQDA